MKQEVAKLIREKGIGIDDELHDDLLNIMTSNESGGAV